VSQLQKIRTCIAVRDAFGRTLMQASNSSLARAASTAAIEPAGPQTAAPSSPETGSCSGAEARNCKGSPSGFWGRGLSSLIRIGFCFCHRIIYEYEKIGSTVWRLWLALRAAAGSKPVAIITVDETCSIEGELNRFFETAASDLELVMRNASPQVASRRSPLTHRTRSSTVISMSAFDSGQIDFHDPTIVGA
jgi:hypothetical protein